MGRLSAESGDTDAALETFEKAMDLKNSVGDIRGRAFILDEVGHLHRRFGNTEEALAGFREAAERSRDADDPLFESQALYHVALAYRDAGKLDEARAAIEDSIRIAETFRARVASHSLRRSFLASVHERYSFYVDLLIQLDRAHPGEGFQALAFQAAERVRARTLRESLQEAAAGIRVGIEPELLEKDRELRRRLNELAIERELLSEASQASRVRREIDALSTEYDQLQSTMRSRSPRYAALIEPAAHLARGSPVAPRRRDAVPRLSSRTRAELRLGGDSRLLLRTRAAPKGGHRGPRTRGVPRPQIAGVLEERGARPTLPRAPRAARGFRGDSPRGGRGRRPQLRSLRGSRRSEERELSARAVPSRSFDFLRPPSHRSSARKGRAGSSIARRPSPPIQSMETGSDRPFGRCLRAGARLLRSPRSHPLAESRWCRVSRPGASGSRRPNFAGFRFLHFATHGVVDDERPELSGIVLSLVDEKGAPLDGFLRLHDIYNLELPVDLVVLSACDTGARERGQGRGAHRPRSRVHVRGRPRRHRELVEGGRHGDRGIDDRALSGTLRRKSPSGGAEGGSARGIEDSSLPLSLLLGCVRAPGGLALKREAR